MYMLGYQKKTTLAILAKLGAHSVIVISVCNCDFLQPSDVDLFDLLQATNGMLDVTAETILRNLVSLCVVYLPTENDLTPTALRYEIFRSVGMPHVSRSIKLYWYDWAVVNGRFLLYFLLFSNHAKLDMKDCFNVDTGNKAADQQIYFQP